MHETLKCVNFCDRQLQSHQSNMSK